MFIQKNFTNFDSQARTELTIFILAMICFISPNLTRAKTKLKKFTQKSTELRLETFLNSNPTVTKTEHVPLG